MNLINTLIKRIRWFLCDPECCRGETILALILFAFMATTLAVAAYRGVDYAHQYMQSQEVINHWKTQCDMWTARVEQFKKENRDPYWIRFNSQRRDDACKLYQRALSGEKGILAEKRADAQYDVLISPQLPEWVTRPVEFAEGIEDRLRGYNSATAERLKQELRKSIDELRIKGIPMAPGDSLDFFIAASEINMIRKQLEEELKKQGKEFSVNLLQKAIDEYYQKERLPRHLRKLIEDLVAVEYQVKSREFTGTLFVKEDFADILPSLKALTKTESKIWSEQELPALYKDEGLQVEGRIEFNGTWESDNRPLSIHEYIHVFKTREMAKKRFDWEVKYFDDTEYKPILASAKEKPGRKLPQRIVKPDSVLYVVYGTNYIMVRSLQMYKFGYFNLLLASDETLNKYHGESSADLLEITRIEDVKNDLVEKAIKLVDKALQRTVYPKK